MLTFVISSLLAWIVMTVLSPIYGNINSGLAQKTSPEGNLHGSGSVNN